MISSKAQIQNQSTIDNERIRQLFNTIDSTSILSPDININQMTPVIDIIFPEQASLNQRHLSANDLKTSFDRFLLWNNNYNKDSSASSFCGEVTNDSTAFITRRQSTAHTSLRDTQYHNQQQQHFHRPSLVIRPRITSSPIRLPSPTTLNIPNHHNINKLQHSLQSFPKNSIGIPTIDCQPRLLITAPAGSHDQITTRLSSIDIMKQQSTNHPTITQTSSTTFCYVPATDSLAYKNLTGTSQSTIISRH